MLGYEYCPKDYTVIAEDLMNLYINDGTSFVAHEKLTVEQAKYIHLHSKGGYDGINHDGTIMVEAKTSNIKIDMCSAKIYKTGKRKGQIRPNRRFDGRGIFSDYTHATLDKMSNKKVIMLISGFLNGRMLFNIEFNFNDPKFFNFIKESLDRKLPAGDIDGISVGVHFSFNNYKECKDLKFVYLADINTLLENEMFFSRGFLDFLLDGHFNKISS